MGDAGSMSVAAQDTLTGAGVQTVTGAKTFNNQTLIRRNPAGTFSLTEINPVITANQDRRFYQPYNKLVKQEGSTYYVIDGITDAVDTSSSSAITALQAANNALTAGRTWKEKILFMGDYTAVSVSLILDSNTILEVVGRLKLANAANLPIIKNRNGTATEASQDHDIELIGGEYDGNKANQTSGFLLNFFTVNRLTITGVRSHDSKSDGLSILGCDDVLIEKCKFIDNGQMGLRATTNTTYGVGANDLKVISCHTSGNGINGLWIQGANATYQYFNAIFSGNTCDDNSISGIYVDWNAFGVDVSANANQGNGNSTGGGGGGDYVVNGQADGAPYFGNGYTQVVGNTSYNSQEHGIFVTYSKNVKVSNNQVSFAQWRGISGTSIVHCQITGNTCVNNGQKTANTYEGIQLNELGLGMSTTDNVIENNTCYDDQGTKTQKAGLVVTNIAYNNIIRNNHLVGNLGPSTSCDLSNCYENEGLRTKRGRWRGPDPVLGADGPLQGMINTFMTTGSITKVIDSSGTRIRFATAAVNNDITGARVAPFTEENQNCVFKCKFQVNQRDANTVVVLGFRSNSALNPSDSAAPLTNFDGVVLFFAANTTWFIKHNNGNSSVTSTDTTTNTDTLVHELAIYCDSSLPRWFVTLDNVLMTNGLQTTDLPNTGVDMGLYWYIRTTTGAVKTFDMWDAEVIYAD